MTQGTLEATAAYSEQRWVFFPSPPSKSAGLLAGRVTLVSRRDQVKDKYDTARYEVRFKDTQHIAFERIVLVNDTMFNDAWVVVVGLDGTGYTVWLRDGTRATGCNCMAGQNKKHCKHIALARAMMAEVPDFGSVDNG